MNQLEFCVQRLEGGKWHFNNGTYDDYCFAKRILSICEKHEQKRMKPRKFRVAVRLVGEWCEAAEKVV